MEQIDADLLGRFADRCAAYAERVATLTPVDGQPVGTALGALRREVHGLSGEAAMLRLDHVVATGRVLDGRIAAAEKSPDADELARLAAWASRFVAAVEALARGADAPPIEAELELIAEEAGRKATTSAPAKAEWFHDPDTMPKRRILVMDDNRLVREMFADLLADHGYPVATAGDLLELEKLLGDFQPEVILTDMIMPEIGGDDICRVLKTRFETEGIPIILMSSASDDELAERAKQAGADGVISKQHGPDEVVAQLETFLSEIVF